MAKNRKPLPPPVVLHGGTQIDAETARRVEEMKRRGGKRSPMETLRQVGSAALGGAIGAGEGAVGLGTFGYDILRDTMTGGPVKRGVQAVSDYAHGAPVDLKVPMPATDEWTREVDKGQQFWEEQGADGPAMSVGRVAGNVVAPGPEAAQVMKTASRPARAFDASRRNFLQQTAAGVAGIPATAEDAVGGAIKSILPDPNSPNIYTQENLDLWARLMDTPLTGADDAEWGALRDEWVNRGLPANPRQYGDGDLVPDLSVFEDIPGLRDQLGERWRAMGLIDEEDRWISPDAMPEPDNAWTDDFFDRQNEPDNLQDIYKLDPPDITDPGTGRSPLTDRTPGKQDLDIGDFTPPGISAEELAGRYTDDHLIYEQGKINKPGTLQRTPEWQKAVNDEIKRRGLDFVPPTSAPPVTPKRPPFDPNADLSKMSEDELGEWMEQAVGELGNQNTLGKPNTWLDESRPFYHGNDSTDPPDNFDYLLGERAGANPENPFPTTADRRVQEQLELGELEELEAPFDVPPIPGPQQATYNDVVRMIEDLQNAPPNPLGPVNRWSGDPFSIYNDSTAPPKWYDYSTAEREAANPDNPFPTQADKAAADRREHEKWMKEYEERQRYYQTLKDERAAHEADPENTSFFSPTTAKGLMERAKQRPVGTPPIVIDRTKEPLDEFRQRLDANGLGLAERYAKDAARPEEVALVRDAAARIAEEYPRALRLVGRIELADTRHMSLGSIINPPLAWYGDDPGGVIKINMNALRDEIAKNGPVAADATLYHELVHAAQHAIRPKGPGDMALEPPAYRRMYRLFGGVDDRQFKAEDLPLSPREKKTGMEDWRYQKPTRRGAPPKSSKPGKW